MSVGTIKLIIVIYVHYNLYALSCAINNLMSKVSNSFRLEIRSTIIYTYAVGFMFNVIFE